MSALDRAVPEQSTEIRALFARILTRWGRSRAGQTSGRWRSLAERGVTPRCGGVENSLHSLRAHTAHAAGMCQCRSARRGSLPTEATWGSQRQRLGAHRWQHLCLIFADQGLVKQNPIESHRETCCRVMWRCSSAKCASSRRGGSHLASLVRPIQQRATHKLTRSTLAEWMHDVKLRNRGHARRPARPSGHAEWRPAGHKAPRLWQGQTRAGLSNNQRYQRRVTPFVLIQWWLSEYTPAISFQGASDRWLQESLLASQCPLTALPCHTPAGPKDDAWIPRAPSRQG